MNIDLLRTLQREENTGFSGWDFSHLEGRWDEEELPWSYRRTVGDFLKDSDVLLDMGTGGGEFLLSLSHPYELKHATEGYEPNFKMCSERLGKLGIDVKFAEDDAELPFNNEMFDIVINKHESYLPKEVRRVLKADGVFITQQVGGRNDLELSDKLVGQRRDIMNSWDMAHAVETLEGCGFEILMKNEYFPKLRFFDTGAVVYFAKVIEWEFPGFSVQSCADALEEIDSQIKTDGFFECMQHRFIICAKKKTQ